MLHDAIVQIKVGAYVSPQSATVHIGGHVTFSIIGKGIKSLCSMFATAVLSNYCSHLRHNIE
jgi:hypothetical protein